MDVELQRLEALHRLDLMDTPPEPEFDELVELAAAICEVPISLLTLLDDKRQFFKAAIGTTQTERPIEATFCQYTIRQDDLLLVEDTREDERFVTHPAVIGDPSVRFYAGISIKTSDGYPVGTLCVADLVPRKMSATQLKTLRVLARHANARLELREQRLTLQRVLSDLEEANVQLRELASTDALTGLANRRAFDQRLAIEFSQARRKKRSLSVIMMDVDNFKQLNDRYGHEEGDRCLKQIATLLAAQLRKSDLIARYGGEEFVLLLPETGQTQAMQLGKRILEAMHTAEWTSPMTISGGVASLGPTAQDARHLISLADDALYAAKHAGKDRLHASPEGDATIT